METSFTKTEEERTDEKAACPVSAAGSLFQHAPGVPGMDKPLLSRQSEGAGLSVPGASLPFTTRWIVRKKAYIGDQKITCL